MAIDETLPRAIAILLIVAGVVAMMQAFGPTTQAATSLSQTLGVLAIAGGVAFLLGSRQSTT